MLAPVLPFMLIPVPATLLVTPVLVIVLAPVAAVPIDIPVPATLLVTPAAPDDKCKAPT